MKSGSYEHLQCRIETARARLGTPSDVLRAHGYAVRARKAFCPFHLDRNRPNLPFFRGTDGKDRFRCWACGAKGDALDLQVKLTGKSIAELL